MAKPTKHSKTSETNQTTEQIDDCETDGYNYNDYEADDNDEYDEINGTDDNIPNSNKTLKEICNTANSLIKKTTITNKNNKLNFHGISVDDYDTDIKFEYINEDGIKLELINEFDDENDETLNNDCDSLYYESNLDDENEDDDDDFINKRSIKKKSNSTTLKKFHFERNTTNRKKHKKRLLQILSNTVYEYSHRVGHQAVVLIASPNATPHFSVIGSQPLRNIITNLQDVVMEELQIGIKQEEDNKQKAAEEKNVVKQTLNRTNEAHSAFELPPLEVNGLSMPVERMTQSQLRAFIPLMLKYSTGRGKPGWGKKSTKPKWWPKSLPWANVRMDVRTDDEKQKISWTEALRKIVKNCYKYHGRTDLLPDISIFNNNQKRPYENDELYTKSQSKSLTCTTSKEEPCESTEEITIDLTEDADEDISAKKDNINHETFPVVIVPPPPPLHTILQQNTITYQQIQQTNKIIYLTPVETNIRATQIASVNATVQEQNVLEIVDISD